MTSTITDRGSAIPLTAAERDALTDHAVHRLYEYDNVADLVGDAGTMRTLAGDLTRAASLTEAAQAGALPADLTAAARDGIDRSLADAHTDAAAMRRHRDRWRAGETGWGWPDLSDDENERAHADEIERTSGRVAALESLAAKLGVK